jgi:hypothetical protein
MTAPDIAKHAGVEAKHAGVENAVAGLIRAVMVLVVLLTVGWSVWCWAQ